MVTLVHPVLDYVNRITSSSENVLSDFFLDCTFCFRIGLMCTKVTACLILLQLS